MKLILTLLAAMSYYSCKILIAHQEMCEDCGEQSIGYFSIYNHHECRYVNVCDECYHASF